ncbi:hypothetical protein ACIRS1_30300 [Kitasatospora sp. NPDC101176]|uniref:hypothetical protein n=1 Tax=Kitasatospora sp. NPDC101176 TaxID=3364099 RepID=UPI00381EAF52
MFLLGFLLFAASGAFIGLLIADNLSGGPEYQVTVLGHDLVTLNSLAIFLSGVALALLFCLGLALMGAGRRVRRPAPAPVAAGGAVPREADPQRPVRRARVGADRAGAARDGEDRIGEERAGEERVGEARIGEERAGEERVGADRAGAAQDESLTVPGSPADEQGGRAEGIPVAPRKEARRRHLFGH